MLGFFICYSLHVPLEIYLMNYIHKVLSSLVLFETIFCSVVSCYFLVAQNLPLCIVLYQFCGSIVVYFLPALRFPSGYFVELVVARLSLPACQYVQVIA